MSKRHVSIFAVIIFIFTILPVPFSQKVYAYTNNSYFNDLKVGLVSMSATNITVTLGGEYTLNGQVYPSGSVLNLGISGTNITLNGSAYSQISLNTNNMGNLLTITSGSVSNKYMGSFVIKVYNGKILPINTIDIENYLKGVVGYEMSDYFPVEALKAQTVAARNYALSRIGYEAAKGYDFDDTISYQVYKGYNASYTRVLSAVEQTKGQVLLYNDKLVETLYSAWHGGVSENSENVWGNVVPYLRSAQDPYENDPWPNGNKVLTNAQIQSTLTTKGYLTSTDTFVKLELASITNFASGRVSNINIVYKDSTGTVKTKSVTKDSTRTFLSLPSNLYTVTYDSVNGAYTFSGKGNGHGLGMSQIGAKNRAAAGQTFDQILKFYYQNTYLQNLILKAALSTFTQSSSTLYVGDKISFNATAAGGNGAGYLFKYVIKSGDNVVLTKDYSSTANLDFVPSSLGSYTVSVYVKDKFSISDYDDMKTASFNVYNPFVLNTFTINKSETLVGQGVTSAVDVKDGSGSYSYKYEVTKDGSLLMNKDFSADKQFVFIPDQPGNYMITAYVKDDISNKSYDFKQSQSFNTYDSLKINEFSKDKESVFLGDSINFSANVNGGSNKGVTYKYVVIKDGETVASRDFDVNNKFSYAPSAAGNYQVEVYVLDAISDSKYDDVKTLNFTATEASAQISTNGTNKTEYLVDQVINLNTVATSGSGSYLYKYIVSRDGAVVSTIDYNSVGNLQYKADVAGTYSITTYVKDALSLKEYDDTQQLTVKVYNKSAMNFISSQDYGLLGNSFNYTINQIDGSGKAQYKFVVVKDTTVIVDTGYSESNTFSFTPIEAGSFKVTGYLKDALSENAVDVQNTLDLTVYKPEISTVTASGSFYEGKVLAFNASSIGSSPLGFCYKYEIYNNGTLVASSNFTAFSSFNFTPTVAGDYIVKVYGKDGISSNSYDSMKQFNVTIDKKPLYLSTLPLKYGMTNSSIASMQSALVKLGYVISDTSGYFGTSTKNAVISFQKSKGLTQDGIVGNMTYGALNDALIQKAGTKTLNY